MKKQLWTILPLAAVVMLYLLPAVSQAYMEELLAPAFPEHERPAAVFNHDEHNEKAGIEECYICHHVYKGKRVDPYDSSEGIPCAECHPVDAEEGTPLRLAYHRQCIECHEEAVAEGPDPEAEDQDAEVNAPLTCGECHVR
jgi:hypothetical protein